MTALSHTTPFTPEGPVALRGALDAERTPRGLRPHRLPPQARERMPDVYLAIAEAQTSGVRLAFRTRATTVELDTLPTKTVYEGAPEGPDGLYDLLVDGALTAQASVSGGDVVTLDMVTGSTGRSPGRPGTARFTGLPAREKTVEIWLPQGEGTELLALRTDAPVSAPPPTARRHWLHHGSSISHGTQADSPTGTWPAVAAARAGVELTNLGFGGNALLDPFTARAVRDAEADLISLKIGINLVNTDVMRLRALGPALEGFLDTVREGRPRTPILLVTPVVCPIVEHTPGPTAPDFDGPGLRFLALGDPADVPGGRLTLTMVREELSRVAARRAATDPRLHLLDGRLLYGEDDLATLPLPDQLHPDSAGHRRMGERFARLAFRDGPFGPPGPRGPA